MIYGQPITFGGGGGNELIVTAPTGSTVTATKDGKTKTATEDNGVFTFKGLETGEWSVTATLGEQSKTGVVTVTAETLALQYLSDTFVDNEWSDIIAACQSGSVPDAWVAGMSKPMTINGTIYTIDIIGKNHDTYAAGGNAPLTFQLHELYATKYRMNNSNTNSGGYDGAEMHNTTLPAIKALMPPEVRAAIKPVNKPTSVGNQSSTIETIACDLFLLSEIEIFGSTKYSVSGEGSQYAYYSAGNSKIKYLSGNAAEWWERSPHGADAQRFCDVYANGTNGYLLANDGLAGVSFAFCF